MKSVQNAYSSVVRALVWFSKFMGSYPTMYSLLVAVLRSLKIINLFSNQFHQLNFDELIITFFISMTSSFQHRVCHHFNILVNRLACLVQLYLLSHFTILTHPISSYSMRSVRNYHVLHSVSNSIPFLVFEY
jgi:hypothetical protein